jgi:cystathionine gamma-synthase
MKFETLCVHPTTNIDDQYGAIATPIYQSATFVHANLDEPSKYSYSRLSNPTRCHLEDLVMKLEQGKSCTGFSTGMAAITCVFKTFKSGDHFICSEDLYGGALRLFRTLKEDNYKFDFIDTNNLELLKSKINKNTKAIYIETPSNPLMNVTDIEEVSKICKDNNLLLIVDNTFLTPYFQKPILLGADIVIHSGTKYLGGHNDTLAGFLITNSEKLGENVLYYAKTIGASLSPFDSFLIERGIKTLPIRMDRINDNAIKIASWLSKEKKVKRVYYVGLESDKGYEINKSQSSGFGGMISIELESEELAKHVLGSVKIFQYAESLGGVDSLITYPMKQTHADLPKEERDKRGINERFLRLSIGIENVNDLINDLKQALEV